MFWRLLIAGVVFSTVFLGIAKIHFIFQEHGFRSGRELKDDGGTGQTSERTCSLFIVKTCTENDIISKTFIKKN